MDNRVNDLLTLVRTYTPQDKSSPLAVYLPGFTSLRLLLEKSVKTSHEDELARTLVESYTSYFQAGKNPADIAWMVARDYQVWSKHQLEQQQQPEHREAPRRESFASSASSISQANNSMSYPGTTAARQLGLHSSTQAPTNQQIYTSISGTQQQQTPAMPLQRLTQNFDFQQQLPGQPSA